jgi:hypothetical protein
MHERDPPPKPLIGFAPATTRFVLLFATLLAMVLAVSWLAG